MVSIVHAQPPKREPEPQEVHRCHACGADLGPTIVWNLPCPGCGDPVQAVEKVIVMTFDEAVEAMHRAEDRYSTWIDAGGGWSR